LHGDVKDELDRQFEINMTKSNSVRIKMTLQVEDREVAVPAHLQNIFAALIYHLTGKFVHPRDSDWEEEDQPSAVAVAAKRARTLLPLTGKSRAEQTWEKVSLVQHAIQCWDRYGQGEPDLGGAKFQDLLQGLSDTVDLDGRRKWHAADLVRSYRRSVKKLEPRNNK
jgi:hypothetical protein